MIWGVFFLKNCIFIEESDFNISTRLSTVRSIHSALAIITRSLIKAISYSVLDVVSAFGVLTIEVRIPKFPKKKKLKADSRERQVAENKQLLKELQQVVI